MTTLSINDILLYDESFVLNNEYSCYKTFLKACIEGNLDIAKAVINIASNNFKEKLIHKDQYHIFRKTVEHDQLNIARYIISITGDLEKHNEMAKAHNYAVLEWVIKNGSLEDIKYIASLISDEAKIGGIAITHHNLKNALTNNDFDKFKLLLSLVSDSKYAEIAITMYEADLLRWIAENLALDEIKETIAHIKDKKILLTALSVYDYHIYRTLLEKEELDKLKFLTSIFPDPDKLKFLALQNSFSEITNYLDEPVSEPYDRDSPSIYNNFAELEEQEHDTGMVYDYEPTERSYLTSNNGGGTIIGFSPIEDQNLTNSYNLPMISRYPSNLDVAESMSNVPSFSSTFMLVSFFAALAFKYLKPKTNNLETSIIKEDTTPEEENSYYWRKHVEYKQNRSFVIE